MNGIENYLGFIIAGIALNLTPGADTIYILTRSIAQGKKAGIYSVLGIGTGAIVHTLFAALGLSALLITSAIAFSIVKWMGAAYLIYLGIGILMDKSKLSINNTSPFEQINRGKIYRQGFLTNLLNPKIAIFFLSLLPQFINPQYTNGPIPFLLLGFTFITTGTIWCFFLVYSAAYMSNKLRENEKLGKITQKLSGLVFIGLGLQLLLKRNE